MNVQHLLPSRDMAPENRVGSAPCAGCGASYYHRRTCALYVTWCHGRHEVLSDTPDGSCPYHTRGRGVIGACRGHHVVFAPARLPWGQLVRDAYVLCPEELATWEYCHGVWTPPVRIVRRGA